MRDKTIIDVILVDIKTLHEAQKNYKCDSCGKSFTESGYLKKHNKTVHEGQRNYKCDSCRKFFTQSSNLNLHIETIHKRTNNFDPYDHHEYF